MAPAGAPLFHVRERSAFMAAGCAPLFAGFARTLLKRCSSFYLCSACGATPSIVTFLIRRKEPKTDQRGHPFGNPTAKTSRRSVPDPFPPPPVAAGGTTARDSTGRDETAPAGYLIAAGQQKPKGITPLTPVPRPLLLSVLA